jgi:hypothetical protein
MSQIDWKSELRKAERQFDGLPPELTAEELRAWRLESERDERRRAGLNGAVGAWTRLFLVALLAAGLNFWPYARTCGVGLYGLLGAELAVVVGGLWVAVYSWRRYAARAHMAAVALALVGASLIAAEMLPRIGYAKPDRSRPSRMSCVG